MSGNPTAVETLDQIVIIDKRGVHHQVPISLGMSADSLRVRVKQVADGERVDVHIHATEATYAHMMKLADELWPDAAKAELPSTEVGRVRVRGHIEFAFTDRYFRALAKIAFHYYLVFNQSALRGDEPEFANVRRFILEGGEVARFIRTPRESPVYFGTPFGDVIGVGTLSSSEWCHLLAFDDTHEHTVVFLQLFIGPGFMGPTHHVVLGPSAVGLDSKGAQAHMALLSTGRSPGLVEPRRVVRGGQPPRVVGPGLEASDMAHAIYTDYGKRAALFDYRERGR